MKNDYENRDGHVVIFANCKGIQREILIDDCDFDTVSSFSGSWYALEDGNTHYAHIAFCRADGKQKITSMHRLLLKPSSKMVVDHINHNGLDNRRENIRIVTNGENQRNRIDNTRLQSDINRVCWQEKYKSWRVSAYVRGRDVYIASIKDQIVAEAAALMFVETGKRVIQSDSRRTAKFQSDVLGVMWEQQIKAWRARVKLNRETFQLGYFETIEEAEAAVMMFRETGKIIKCSKKRYPKQRASHPRGKYAKHNV